MHKASQFHLYFCYLRFLFFNYYLHTFFFYILWVGFLYLFFFTIICFWWLWHIFNAYYWVLILDPGIFFHFLLILFIYLFLFLFLFLGCLGIYLSKLVFLIISFCSILTKLSFALGATWQACRERIKALQTKITARNERIKLLMQRGTPDSEPLDS